MSLARAGTNLGLLRAAHLLHSVLSFLALLSGPLFASQQSIADKSVFGLKLFRILQCVVDERKTAGLTATEGGLEAKAKDQIGSGLVHAGDLFTDLSLRHSRSVAVDNVDNLKIKEMQNNN